MLSQWFLTSIWKTVAQIPTLKHNNQEYQLMQPNEGGARARTTSFFSPSQFRNLRKQNSCAGSRHHLSGCSASSSAWSQELCTTGWPRTRSSHHPCAGPARNPGSTNTKHQPLQGNSASYPAQPTRQSLHWGQERWESCKNRLWNQISQPVKRR